MKMRLVSAVQILHCQEGFLDVKFEERVEKGVRHPEHEERIPKRRD